MFSTWSATVALLSSVAAAAACVTVRDRQVRMTSDSASHTCRLVAPVRSLTAISTHVDTKCLTVSDNCAPLLSRPLLLPLLLLLLGAVKSINAASRHVDSKFLVHDDKCGDCCCW